MKQMIYFLLIFTLCSCFQDTKRDNQRKSNYSNSSSYHTDSNYKYEYRTGSSGDYEYNYDISGWDEDGNSVHGNIDIEGKYGSGYVEDEYGDEKYIEVEWVDYGVLEGTDEDGNHYELEVDE